MKIGKKIVLLVMAVICLSLSSCAGGGDGYIYDNDSELTLIVGDLDIPPKINTMMYDAIGEARGIYPDSGTSNKRQSKHEIIIGECDRELSVTAYEQLRVISAGSGDVRMLAYSDGESIAIAFDLDENYYVAEWAIGIFIKEYIKASLITKPGIVMQRVFSYAEIVSGKYEEEQDEQRAEDLERQERAWEYLAAAAGEGGEELVSALRQLYGCYDSSVITWLANLYSPYHCVCGTDECRYTTDSEGNYLCSPGGFYYSNSSRDGGKYLPNLESTSQAMSILDGTGATSNAYSAIPGWMRDELLSFARRMQNPVDGYFYHPQWGAAITEAKRSRDLSQAMGIIKGLGRKPLYDTPTGVKGELSGAQSALYLTGRLGTDAEIMVAHVLPCASVADSNPKLRDKNSFQAYLDTLAGNGKYQIGQRSYHIGSDLTIMSANILQRDRELAAEGADYRLMDMLIEFLNEWQHPDTGHWHSATNFYAASGVLKILGVYAAAGVEVPHAEELAASMLSLCDNLEAATLITDLYNVWGSLEKVVLSVTNNAPSINPETGKTRAQRVAELRARIYEIAPDAIRATAISLSHFKMDDGGFSYYKKGALTANAGKQGGAVVADNVAESDVNGTMLATYGLVHRILSPLGLKDCAPPIYGRAELNDFLKIISERYAEVNNAE